MKLITLEHIPGQEFDVLGMVKGNVVQSKMCIRDRQYVHYSDWRAGFSTK